METIKTQTRKETDGYKETDLLYGIFKAAVVRNGKTIKHIEAKNIMTTDSYDYILETVFTKTK